MSSIAFAEGVSEAAAIVRLLADGLEEAASEARTLVEIAQGADGGATADLGTGRVEVDQKTGWRRELTSPFLLPPPSGDWAIATE